MFKGRDLEYAVCSHPFVERDSLVINADYVTLETGTGCVHIAPGHGHEDYVAGLKYNLQILNPVDASGHYTNEFELMKGEHVFAANLKIVELLKEKKALLAQEEITHSYAHCWRCKSPIIYRATNQWFISMEKNNFRAKALDEVKNVKWFNEWGEDRISKMISGRPDWCISRQRSWGVPIFVFTCKDCGESIVTEKTIAKVRALIKEEGSDGWFKHTAKEILGEESKCPKCGSGNVDRGNDIFDVWFDSGASSFSVLETRDDLSWPADLYLEGSDQYRGWFQSSLLAAVGFRGKAPFKSVISHGWILDGQGRAMHKSLGNVINPLDLIKKGGADVLRLWVASEDFTADQSISEEIMSRVTDSYRRIRNTFRYMLSAVNDFKKEDAVPYEKLSAFDKYALHRMQVLLDSLDKYYEKFEFHRVYREFTNLCSTFLSSYYFDVLKDRLYTFKSNGIERRGAQTVIYKMLINLTKAIAPVLAFTADEVWQFIPEGLKDEPHVQLEKWTKEKEPLLSEEEVQDWEIFNKLRDAALKKIEDKRKEKILNHPYEAVINISYASAKLDRILKKLSKEEVEQMIIVSGVSYSPAGKLEDKEWDFGLEITAGKSGAVKCERCWRYTDTTGKNPEYPGLCSRCVENLG